MGHSRPSHHPSPPPVAPVTRAQSPRALSCDAQLRPLCLSLPAPGQKPGLCSAMPIPKKGCGAFLPFLCNSTFSYSSLEIPYPKYPRYRLKRVSHSLHSLGAPAPAHCPGGNSELRAMKTHYLLALASRWKYFQAQAQISMWEFRCPCLTKLYGCEKPEVLLVSPIRRGKTRAGVQPQIHIYSYAHTPHSPSVAPTARRAPITATWKKHFLSTKSILSSSSNQRRWVGVG